MKCIQDNEILCIVKVDQRVKKFKEAGDIGDVYKNALEKVIWFWISSVIWQKGEYQNGGNKNTKHAKFSEKRTFFTP